MTHEYDDEDVQLSSTEGAVDPSSRSMAVHEVEWNALAPHAARNALFEVSRQLDLRAVAQAIRDDDTTAVSAWLEDGELARPDDASLAAFAEQDARFRFVIVQPWVVAQRLMD